MVKLWVICKLFRKSFMQVKLDYIEKFTHPERKTEAVVIFLHGLGADYNDFLPIVDELTVDKPVKFIFPNAPMRPITINGGYVMRGWYDIRDFNNLEHSTDVEGINNSVAQIEELIKQQVDLGISTEKVILAGFSQGGVISYVTAVSTKYKLGGVLPLSCYLPATPLSLENSINKQTPFFAIHGIEDQVVPHLAGLTAYNTLSSKGFNIKWAEYPMAHSVCLEEILAIKQWLNQII